jgi:hypothetical protein
MKRSAALPLIVDHGEYLSLLKLFGRKYGLENLKVVSCHPRKTFPLYNPCRILSALSLPHVRNVSTADTNKRDTSSEGFIHIIQCAKECAATATWPPVRPAAILHI